MNTLILQINSGFYALQNTSTGVASYIPYIQTLCYAIAGLLSIVCAYCAYWNIQVNNQNSKRAVTTSFLGAICFVSMAIGLPKFFEYDIADNYNGNIADNIGTGSDSGGSSEEGYGQPINTHIPDLGSDEWMSSEEYDYYEAEDMYIRGNGGVDPDYEMYVTTINYLDLKYGHVTIQELAHMAGPWGPGEGTAWDALYEFGYINMEQYENFRI